MHNHYQSYITPTVALFVFVLILLIALLIAGFTNPARFDYTRTKIFISCLAGLGIFVTFLFYYAVVTLQQAQQRYAIIELTAQLNKSLVKGVITNINLISDKVPHFTSSLLPLLNNHVEKDKDTVENNFLKFNLSYKIFSFFQELIIATPLIDLEETSFLSLFLQYASSKQLYHYWLISKLNFNHDTQIFGDLLFKYASTIQTPTIENYIQTAKLLEQDADFIKIINC